ncbi:MAG: hypothetical protein IJC84_00195 [Clostridia bacterium]|nr:hypothetical protein [Clostridia bacterium]
MFAKLLKYDLKSVLRYWWVAAVSSVGLTVLACLCGKILAVEYTAMELFQTLAAIAMVFFILGIFLFPVLNTVLVYMRFYKNFFTDEGYLTFTLPVTTAQLLSSKLLCSFIFGAATVFVLIFDCSLAMAIIIPEEFFSLDNWKMLFESFHMLITETFGYGWFTVFSLESLLILIPSTLYASLFFMLCLTLAFMRAKKHRVLAAVAIYYVINMALSFVSSFLMLDGTWLEVLNRFCGDVPDSVSYLNLSMFLLIAIALTVLATAVLYTILHRMLEKKLNLD